MHFRRLLLLLINLLVACALGPDLKLLEHGDMTEIGEKGINVSTLTISEYNRRDAFE